MSYVDQNLMPGESIQYRGKLHGMVFLQPLFWLVMTLLAFGIDTGIGVFVLLIALVSAAGAYITFSNSEFAITNKRVIIKTGFVRRVSLELLLNKVEGIGVQQGVLGRILGYGTIVVNGTGGSKTPARMINDPMKFRSEVNNRIAELSAVPAAV